MQSAAAAFLLLLLQFYNIFAIEFNAMLCNEYLYFFDTAIK